MLALVVQLFTEQSARMKTLEERSNEGPPEVRHPWRPIERPGLLGNDVRKCGGEQNLCPEEELNADVRDALLSLWEQLQVLLYYPLDIPWDRILLIIVSAWLLLSRMSAFGRSSIRMPSPEVEVHEVNSTPRRSVPSKGSSRSAKKDRDDTHRTVSGASGRRLQRELQKELRSKSRERRNAREFAQNDTPRNGEAARIASRRRRSRSAERERREQGERSSSDSSRTDVQRNNLRAFEILCRQLPQTPPLHHRSFLSHRICRFKNPFLQIPLN